MSITDVVKRISKIKILILSLIVLAILGYMYIHYTWSSTINEISKESMQTAMSASIAFNGEMFKKLSGTQEDLGTIAYESIKKRAVDLTVINKEIHFAYIYTQRNGKIYFMVDSEAVSSKDYSPPGQEYTEADSETKLPFENGEALITKPSTDRWGKWVSVLVPMKDSETGETVAVFGMDYPAGTWANKAVEHTFQAGFIVLIILLLLLAVYIIYNKNMIIQKERESLKNIIEGTNIGTWEWNVQTGYTKFNDRWAGILGYSLEEISPVSIKTWHYFIQSEDLKVSEKLLNQVFSKEIEYYDCECRMKHKDGRWVWVQVSGKVTSWTPDGKPLLMSGTNTDISEKKKAETLLTQTRHNYETFFNTIDEFLFVLDEQGNTLHRILTMLLLCSRKNESIACLL